MDHCASPPVRGKLASPGSSCGDSGTARGHWPKTGPPILCPVLNSPAHGRALSGTFRGGRSPDRVRKGRRRTARARPAIRRQPRTAIEHRTVCQVIGDRRTPPGNRPPARAHPPVPRPCPYPNAPWRWCERRLGGGTGRERGSGGRAASPVPGGPAANAPGTRRTAPERSAGRGGRSTPGRRSSRDAARRAAPRSRRRWTGRAARLRKPSPHAFLFTDRESPLPGPPERKYPHMTNSTSTPVGVRRVPPYSPTRTAGFPGGSAPEGIPFPARVG